MSVHCTLGGGAGSLHSWDFVLETPVFLLLAVMGLNQTVGLFAPSVTLRRGELATIFLMLLAAAPIPSLGFLSRLIPALGGLIYYVTPETEIVLPHVPSWLAPRDPEAVRLLFEGLPRGGAVPWVVWIRPLAFWCGFFITLSVASVCLAVLLRKQWVERERLAYPIMGLALSLLEPSRSPGERSVWRTRALWTGAALAFGMASLHPLSHHLEAWVGWRFQAPRLNYYWFSPERTYVLRFKLSWAILGLTYLIPQNVALTVWLFNLIYQLQFSTYRAGA